MARARTDEGLGLTRGTGSATTVSPETAATHPSLIFYMAHWAELDGSQAVPSGWPIVMLDASEEFDAAEVEIAAAYKRRLAGLRGLSRIERAAALRAARLWQVDALRELRERRAAARRMRQLLRQWQIPPP